MHRCDVVSHFRFIQVSEAPWGVSLFNSRNRGIQNVIRLTRYFALLTLMSLVCGCGESTPKTYPVSGVVTLDDKPVAGATITFIADTGKNSGATTSDAQGKYTMSTFKQGDGAIAGSYKITVAKYQKEAEENPYGDSVAPEVEQTPEAISEAYSKGYSGPPKGKAAKAPKEWNDVPAKYADVSQSGLTFVVDTKPNTFDIKLSSKK
jgi:hypothetical protein